MIRRDVRRNDKKQMVTKSFMPIYWTKIIVEGDTICPRKKIEKMQ